MLSLLNLDEAFDSVNIFGEVFDAERDFASDITVTNKADSNFDAGVLSLDLVDYPFDSVLSSFHPGSH